MLREGLGHFADLQVRFLLGALYKPGMIPFVTLLYLHVVALVTHSFAFVLLSREIWLVLQKRRALHYAVTFKPVSNSGLKENETMIADNFSACACVPPTRSVLYPTVALLCAAKRNDGKRLITASV